MLTSTLLLGLVIGMQHAFEADHLAAVSTLVSRRKGWRAITRHGALWGSGHALALLAVSAVVLFSPWELPESFGAALELVVGLLLVALGGRLLYRLWRDKVHVHAHQHGDGSVHVHLHSHRDDPKPHDESDHQHEHVAASWRTLLVGMTQGAAGSAALTVFVAASLESPAAGMLYVVLFGVGSVLGMVVLSTIVALPLTVVARRVTWAHRALQVVIGLASIAIGGWLVVSQAPALLT